MEKTVIPESREASQQKQYCSYCQAELNPVYYFCPRCAAPYKEIPVLLPPTQEAILSDGQALRLKAPAAMTLFWIYFSAIILIMGVSAVFAKEGNSLFLLTFSTIVFSTLTLVLAIVYWPSLKGQFQIRQIPLKYAALGLAGLVALLALNYGYSSLLRYLLEINSPYSLLREELGSPFLGTLLICIMPALTEEIAFRGLLQKWLSVALSRRKAFLLCAALFGALHLSVIGFPYLFLMGLFLCWIKEKTGSLYPVIAIHFLHNFIVLTMF